MKEEIITTTLSKDEYLNIQNLKAENEQLRRENEELTSGRYFHIMSTKEKFKHLVEFMIIKHVKEYDSEFVNNILINEVKRITKEIESHHDKLRDYYHLNNQFSALGIEFNTYMRKYKELENRENYNREINQYILKKYKRNMFIVRLFKLKPNI
jgi:hypothetical protein